MTAGRPTKLTPEIFETTQKYIDDCQDKIEHFEGESGRQWETIRVKIPTVEGLAKKLKVSRSTIYEWKKDNQEFSDIIEELMSEQSDRLINMGLQGQYNPTITKVLLTKHGYSDKQEIEQTLKGEVQFINDIPRNADNNKSS